MDSFYDKKTRDFYKEEVVPYLKEKFQYKNNLEIPKIEKIVINRGLGVNAQNNKLLQKSIDEFRLITGQQPVVTTAKKSIAGFKVRETMPLGLKTTLRKEKMYSFLDRLIHITLPRIRDFRGISPNGFDGRGNYSLGLKDQLIFPEISYDDVAQLRGFDITVVTTAKTDEEALALLKGLGMPLAAS